MSSPVLALLSEPDYGLKAHALETLDQSVDYEWAQIADHISQIEELHEDNKFPAPELAALVASKVYYNLGEYDASMRFALLSGDRFDLSAKTEYVQTIVSKCLSEYIKEAQQAYGKHTSSSATATATDSQPIDARLVAVAERMISQCIKEGDYKLALGVSLEARRLDIIQKILGEVKPSEDKLDLIHYVLESSITVVSSGEFRREVLQALVPLTLTGLDTPDYFAVCKIIVQLNDADLAVRLFDDLLSDKSEKSSDKKLTAFQVAFDLVSSAPQRLVDRVSQAVASHAESNKAYAQVVRILSGVPTCDYNITFLQKHNQTDLSILNKTKSLLDGRNSIFHSAVTFENAFMHAGTTADGFFRSNLEWLSRATNWTKFSATAALGVIHQGDLSQGMRILQPYLPSNTSNSPGTCYSQGGSLYALGLIFAGHGRQVLDYLRQFLAEQGETATQAGPSLHGQDLEVVYHGASLGVGVAGMASGNVELYEELRNILFSDSAVAGEAAGLAMGLVMAGTAGGDNEEAEIAQAEMLQYAHDTQHEKIIRSLAMGIALINYGKEHAADEIIERLIAEQDPILRYGGAFTIALAYAGTGSNYAVKRLLHIAVSDLSNDVRRAAVMGLGFILMRNYTAVPRMVELLSESHNPHVRYGTAMALGISCAGTGLKQAIEVLEPMLKDPVDFVRQGSMIALAMILIQQNDKTCPKLKQIREGFAKVIAAKHEDAMARFGAAVAQGIIDAGGRNVTISMEHAQTGSLNMSSVIGLAVFVQYWYWFPLTHFLSLALTPTMIVGVREDLKMPKFEFTCNANPALFEYVPKIEVKNEKAPEKLVTAILSTTKKAQHRAKKTKKKRSGDQDSDVEMEDQNEDKPKEDAETTMDVDDENASSSAVATAVAAPIAPEKQSFKVENLSRVLPSQLKYISFDKAGRFVPIRNFCGVGGVIVVVDQKPSEAVELMQTVRQANSPDDEENEAPLPEPFVYDDALDEVE